MASAAAALFVPRAWAGAAGGRTLRADDLDALTPFEREHLPVLRIPTSTANGNKVPIVVEMSHPMTPDHHVRTIRVWNRSDPVPSKGTFRLTPANGRVHLAFQAQMHHGVSEVSVTAECNRHGEWSISRGIEIPDHAGG